jgi:hypothetical protein
MHYHVILFRRRRNRGSLEGFTIFPYARDYSIIRLSQCKQIPSSGSTRIAGCTDLGGAPRTHIPYEELWPSYAVRRICLESKRYIW